MLRVVVIVVAAGCGLVAGAGDDPNPPAGPRPPWQRLLQGDDEKKAQALLVLMGVAEAFDNYDDAVTAARELVELRTRVQGKDHWQTTDARMVLDAYRTMTLIPAARRAAGRAAALGRQKANDLIRQGRYPEAEPLLRGWEKWCVDNLGEGHSATGVARVSLGLVLHHLEDERATAVLEAALAACTKSLGEDHPDTAAAHNNLGMRLGDRGQFTAANSHLHRAVTLFSRTLGDDHQQTASGVNNFGMNLYSQGEYATAGFHLEKALASKRKARGDDHPEVALCYNNVALNLLALGEVSRAEDLFRRAIDIYRSSGRDGHPELATTSGNLGLALYYRGRYADAAGVLEKAISLCRAAYGEEHGNTALVYNNLALCLDAQGNRAEARLLYERAVRIAEGALRADHPTLAIVHANMGYHHVRLRNYGEAESYFLKAWAINARAFGAGHPLTALIATHLGTTLAARGEHRAAESLHEEAMAVCERTLGPKHYRLAVVCNNLGLAYHDQGRHDDALVLMRRGLDITTNALGGGHPEVITTHGNIGLVLRSQGKYGEACAALEAAVRASEANRLHAAARGIDRALVGDQDTAYELLGVTLAQRGRPADAWAAVEADRARGLLDGWGRASVPLSAAEGVRVAAASRRLAAAQARIPLLNGLDRPTPAEAKELVALRAEQHQAETELAEVGVSHSKRQLATLKQVQQALPPDAALITWVDAQSDSSPTHEHWGCVVRPAGEPVFEKLPGTGANGAWREEDGDAPFALRSALRRRDPPPVATLAELAARLHAQRLRPFEKHLGGVKHLFVIPTGDMAGVPVEFLTDRYQVTYIPSGTVLARLKQAPKPAGRGALVVGDAAYSPALAPKGPPPPGGLLITRVTPEGNAARSLLADGDVILKYAGAEVADVAQLRELIQKRAGEKTVEVTFWRSGTTAVRNVDPGPLGVVIAPDPAPQALADRWAVDQVASTLARGGDWEELPGTAVEVAALKELFGKDATTLVRSEASERKLASLRAAGRLKEFRYLHFATHGAANNVRAFESALILSLKDRSPLPTDGGKVFDGRLTAGEVLDGWQLDADLVTLSGCGTGLGKPGGGDGMLGFAQAFLIAGSRCVCLSLWSVDDSATALLMSRFYANLLDKRAGQPMTKAAALTEAKRWLRNLSVEDATALTAQMTKGVAREKGEKAFEPVVPRPPDGNPPGKEFKPYAHPRYWAAFVLVGDPD